MKQKEKWNLDKTDLLILDLKYDTRPVSDSEIENALSHILSDIWIRYDDADLLMCLIRKSNERINSDMDFIMNANCDLYVKWAALTQTTAGEKETMSEELELIKCKRMNKILISQYDYLISKITSPNKFTSQEHRQISIDLTTLQVGFTLDNQNKTEVVKK